MKYYSQLLKLTFIGVLFILILSNCSIAFNLTNLTDKQIIVVITPHPDDAEASCGGLIANSIANGDEVIILTMTGGELGIWGKSWEEAREIRKLEAINAAKILNTNLLFFGAMDAYLSVDTATTDKLAKILSDINPDIVLAPWPLDVHNDHQATGILAWRVFQDNQFSFDLYFYETTNTPHTKTFQFVPTDYIDITDVMEIKRNAALQHKSQGVEDWFYMYEDLAKYRGYESDVDFAEGYIKAQNSSGLGKRSNIVSKELVRNKP